LSNIAESFISRWKRSSASERANYALFLSELCDLIEVSRPDPSTSDGPANTYVIDKAVVFKELDGSSTTNFIDLYKRNCFVLEAKQGSNPQPAPGNSLPAARKQKRGTAVRGTIRWDEAMLAARGQAERYAKALPASEGWPPFLIVVDVGHSIELYADATGRADGSPRPIPAPTPDLSESNFFGPLNPSQAASLPHPPMSAFVPDTRVPFSIERNGFRPRR
jgi:hypothetical protein